MAHYLAQINLQSNGSLENPKNKYTNNSIDNVGSTEKRIMRSCVIIIWLWLFAQQRRRREQNKEMETINSYC